MRGEHVIRYADTLLATLVCHLLLYGYILL